MFTAIYNRKEREGRKGGRKKGRKRKEGRKEIQLETDETDSFDEI